MLIHKFLFVIHRKKWVVEIFDLKTVSGRFFPLKMFQLLTFIINFSLKSGVVPSEWKVAKVIPLYKSGSLAEIDDYTPISILPTLWKIL